MQIVSCQDPVKSKFLLTLALEVLFCVLVLHLVTSKDSYNVGSTQSNSQSRNANTSVHASKTADKLAKFRFGPNGSHGPTVTTHISATRDLGNVAEDEEDMGFEARKNGGRSYPLEIMKVQVRQVVEVDTGAGRGSRDSTPRSLNDEEMSRGRSHRSTEELVEREISM